MRQRGTQFHAGRQRRHAARTTPCSR
ncbi:MAG: hypothetical protein MZW92_80625 [Comamonadaceae bacterium]|nr:hypothetical protein [Comamonadaceae bacterium]